MYNGPSQVYCIEPQGRIHQYTKGLVEVTSDNLDIWADSRLPDKRVYWTISFFISHPKHMLWVLKEPSQ